MWLFNAEEREARKKTKDQEHRARQAANERWQALLRKALSIGEVNFTCHDDLWRYISSACSVGVMHSGFIHPERARIIRGDRGMITVPVSGRTLAVILERMGKDAGNTYLPAVNQAAARTVLDASTAALNGYTGQSGLDIVIDDRP